MAKKAKGPRSKVFLVAFSSDGSVVERVELTFDEYYEGIHPLVDSDAYRATKKIRHMQGEIYGHRGNVMQTFDVDYTRDGAVLKQRAVHDDGSVIESSGNSAGPPRRRRYRRGTPNRKQDSVHKRFTHG